MYIVTIFTWKVVNYINIYRYSLQVSNIFFMYYISLVVVYWF